MTGQPPAGYTWVHDIGAVDLDELSQLYRIAPLGNKPPDALATVFGNSMFTCFVYHGATLAGAGRALADGLDCAYIADVAVHPDHQGRGLGSEIIRRLVAAAQVIPHGPADLTEHLPRARTRRSGCPT